MFALYDSLVGYFDAHPGKGFIASVSMGGLHLVGRLAIHSAGFFAQTNPVTPAFIVWCGYLTVVGTTASIFLGVLIQVKRYRSNGDSRPPFHRKRRKHHYDLD